MISLQKANFVTFKKPTLRKTTKTYAKYTKYDDVKQYEENVLSVFKNAESIEKINGRVAQVGWSLALYYELTKQEYKSSTSPTKMYHRDGGKIKYWDYIIPKKDKLNIYLRLFSAVWR